MSVPVFMCSVRPEPTLSPSRAAVGAARVAGLLDRDGREQREALLEAPPQPARENLRGRVLEAGDLVQVAMVELAQHRIDRLLDVGEVDEPAARLVDLARDPDTEAEAVTVEPRALVSLGHRR